VHKLPPRFNEDMLRECQRLSLPARRHLPGRLVPPC
jgi:hypothetical protein